MAAGVGLEQQVERVALREELVEPAFQLIGRVGLEPCAETQQIGLVGGQARHRVQRLGDDLEPDALLPEHKHLRLGLDDGLGRHEIPAQLGRLGLRQVGGSLRGAQDNPEQGQGDRAGAGEHSSEQELPRAETGDPGASAIDHCNSQDDDTCEAGDKDRAQLPARAIEPGLWSCQLLHRVPSQEGR